MTSVGVMASSVVTAVCTDVLQEPFDNVSAWGGVSPTIAAGRTGNALSLTGTTARAEYLLGARANEYVTIGFAWRTNTVSVNQRVVAELWADGNTNPQVRLVYNGTTAQTFTVYRGPATGAPLGTTTATVAVNTWAYIELQARLHDTAGSVTVRINGTDVLTLTNVDTSNAAIVPTFDAVRLTVALAGVTNLWDDLYLSAGSGCAFQGDHTIVNAGPDIILEPFTHLGSWVQNSTPALVTGRNGNAAEINSISDRLDLNIPTGLQTDTLTMGFAWRTPALQPSHEIVNLRSDAGATLHNTLTTDSTGRLQVNRAGVVIAGPVTTGLAVDTWYYLEWQIKLHDTAGTSIVRVNGTEVINATGLDTRNAGTKTVYDQVRLATPNGSSGGTNQFDDMYVSAGAVAFKGDITIP